MNVALRAAKMNEIFTVWGDGNVQKDYVFVEDFCRFLFEFIERDVWGELINVGSGQLYSVNEILHLVKLYYPSFSWNYVQTKKNDVSHLELDLNKLNSYVSGGCKTLKEVFPSLLKEW